MRRLPAIYNRVRWRHPGGNRLACRQLRPVGRCLYWAENTPAQLLAYTTLCTGKAFGPSLLTGLMHCLGLVFEVGSPPRPATMAPTLRAPASRTKGARVESLIPVAL
jgi:hypothetical protein